MISLGEGGRLFARTIHEHRGLKTSQISLTQPKSLLRQPFSYHSLPLIPDQLAKSVSFDAALSDFGVRFIRASAVERTVTEMRNSNADMSKAPAFLGVLGIAAAREGRKAEGRTLLDRIEAMRNSTHVEPYMGLELAIALGDPNACKTGSIGSKKSGRHCGSTCRRRRATWIPTGC